MPEVSCTYGSSTENPCPRPGTAARRGVPEVLLCQVHAALEPLWDEVDDLGLALEKLEELEQYATEWDNQPIKGLVERARVEFAERKEFLERHAQAVSLAGRKCLATIRAGA